MIIFLLQDFFSFGFEGLWADGGGRGIPTPFTNNLLRCSQRHTHTHEDTHTNTQRPVVAACVVGRLNIFLVSLGSG